MASYPGRIAHLVTCFGDQEFVVTGYLAPPWGIGGLSNGVTPSWLGEWAGLESVLWVKPHPADGCPTDQDCLWSYLFAPDSAAIQLTPDRWVTVTGHFDDPRSLTCRATGTGYDAVPTDAEAIVTCREHFVVTEMRTAVAPTP